MPALRGCVHEYLAQHLHSSPVVNVEAFGAWAIDVPYAEQATVGADEGHHDFRTRSGVAENVVGVGVDVGYQLGFARLRGQAAYALAERDANAGRLALEGADHQLVAVEQVEAGPVDLGQGMKNQRGEIGGIGNQVLLVFEQRTRLSGQFGVHAGLVGGGECGGMEHDESGVVAKTVLSLVMSHDSPQSALAARHEHRQSERLDNFVDGAFAFAITLLVISGADLPRSVDALEHALRGIPAFAVCFVQLALFWHGHVRWREIVGGTDGTGLRLSLLLVFFALIFVFPLHLVYASLFNSATGGILSPDFVTRGGQVDLGGMQTLFVCYGLSYACMGGTLWALFRHGARSAHQVSSTEVVGLRVHAAIWAFATVIGFVSMVVALCAVNGAWISVAGFIYALLALTGVVAERARRRALAGQAMAEN